MTRRGKRGAVRGSTGRARDTIGKVYLRSGLRRSRKLDPRAEEREWESKNGPVRIIKPGNKKDRE